MSPTFKSITRKSLTAIILLMLLMAAFSALPVSAAITTTVAGTNVYHSATAPNGTVASFAIGGTAGSRMLVVMVTVEGSFLGSGTYTYTSVQYGGQNLTLAGGDATGNLYAHSLIFYLKDNSVMDGTSKALSFNGVSYGGSDVMHNVWYAVYNGVDQAATPAVQNYNNNSSTTTAAFGTALTINANDQAVIVGCSARASGTVTWSTPTNWTRDNSQTSTGPGLGFIAHRAIPTSDTSDNYSSTVTSSRVSMTGMSLKAATTTVADGATPASKSVKGSDTNKAVSAFTLATGSAGTGDVVTGMTVTVSGTGPASVSAVKIYQDNGSTANEWDATDTLKGTATYSSPTATFSGLNIAVTNTAVQYLITVDTVASPTTGQTILAAVAGVTSNNIITNNDSTDATLTIDATAPTVSSINRADTNPIGTGTVHWTVNFSESVSNVGTNDFALVKTGGITGESISTVTGSGAGPYTVTANTGAASGTLGLNLAASPTITDAAGNALTGGFTGEVYTVKLSSTTSLTTSGSPSTYGDTVTFTATVTNTATGDVNFRDGTTVIGTATLNGSVPNQAVFTTSALKVAGSPHSITANYLGDASYFISSSTSIGQTVNPKALNVTGLSVASKTYDGNTAASVSGTPALSGIIGSDVVDVTGTPAGVFANKNVGSAKTVTLSGLSLTGADAGNYTLTAPGFSADINAKDLTISATATDKQYDTTTTASVTLSSDKLSGDTVTTAFVSANFVNKNVGTAKTVNVTGITIGGADAGNYHLLNVSATATAAITAKPLTMTGVTANSKVYDGGTAATLTGTPALVGIIDGDNVTVINTPTAAFASKNVANGITVTVAYTLGGTEAGNYSLTQPTLLANITPKGLTITGLTADSKVYNGNTTAAMSGAAHLNGIVGSETVVLGGTPVANFNNKNVGANKPVTVTGYTISDTNYSLSQPAGLQADITSVSLTPHVTAADKVYDGTTTATILTRTLTGVVASEDVSLAGGNASFTTPAVGAGKTVTVTSLSLSGADIANYVLSSTTATTTASITGSISGNAGVVGVTLSYTDGTPKTATSTTGGAYTLVVSPGWTGSVTPSLFGYTFAPTSRSYSNVMANISGENYTATAIPVHISGNAGVGYAVINFTGGTPVTADISGVYNITVPYNWSGTVTPSLTGYAFSPVNRVYTNVISDQTAQNYTAVASGIIYYVDKTSSQGACSDTANDGKSSNHPFCTIGKAAGLAAPGNTVNVLAGTYSEKVIPANNGTAGNPITFVAGTSVVMNGSHDHAGTDSAFRLDYKSYIVINGFTIDSTIDEAIYVNASNHISILNNTVTHTGSTTTGLDREGISFYDTTDSTVSGNTTALNSGSGIQVSGASTNIVISNNLSYGNAAVYVRTSNGIFITGTTSNITVLHNVVYNNEDTGIGLNGTTHNNFIIGNLSYGNGDHGIDDSGSMNNAIVGNTIQGNVTVGINLEGEDATHNASGSTVQNNISVDNGMNPPTGLPGNIRVDTLSTPGTTVDYNVVWQTGGSTYYQYTWNTTQYDSLSAFQTATCALGSCQEVHGYQINPQFVAPAGPASRPVGGGHPTIATGDYHITSASAAIDSANSNASSESTTDIEGNPRVDVPATTNTGAGTRTYDDRGAYELQVVTVSLSNLSQTYDGSPKPITATTTPAGLSVSITYNGSSTVPTNANSYTVVATITQPGSSGTASGMLVISPKAISITGLTANNKVYDANVSATLTGTAALSGVVGSDVVNLGGTPAATFANKVVANNKPVTVTGYTISGGGAGNYTLSQPSGLTANITAKGLTVTGVIANDKIYDGDTTAALTGTPALAGVISGDTVVLGAPNANFADKNVGTGKAVSTNYTLSGADAGNYTVSQPAGLTANITAKGLTITGLTASNKAYDGGTTATLSGTAALSGVVSGDVVTPGGTPVATFADKNIGPAKAVTVTGYSIGGAGAGNYTVSQPAGLIANITAKGLTINGLTADNKVYDGNSTAILSGTAALNGVVGSEDVNLAGSPVAAFANKNVGTAKAVTVTGYSINGADAGNYTVSQPAGLTANITAKGLSITGLTANDKVYDGSTAASLSGTAALSGVVSGDVVTPGGTPVATFADKIIGTGKAVTVTGYTIGGADAGNYTVSQPAGLTANITAKGLTITGLTADNKVYDGLTAATLSGTAALSGVVSGDVVTPSGTPVATFADKNIGPAKAVTVTGYTIGGAGAGNYTVSQPAGLTANITAKGLTITGLTASNKIYDGTTAASLSGLPQLSGEVSGDVVNLGGTPVATFADKNIGTGKAVTVGGYTISGTGAGNYTLSQPAGLTANITAKGLSITGLTADNKVYDGLTAATLSGTASLNGKVLGDTVNLSAPNATFADKNVGTGKAVTPHYTISGADAGNYSLTQPSGLAADITSKPLTVTGLTADNKVYDGNASVSLSGIASLSGVVSGEDVNLGGAPVATFANKNVGTAKPVTIVGYSISGADISNYTFSQPAGVTADITAVELTITGVTASNKVYDGSTTASLTGTEVLHGVIGLDVVNLGAANATFANKNIGTGKAVTTNYTVSGTDAGNYSLTQPSGLTANITPAILTPHVTAADKVYDGTTSANILTRTLTGIIDSENVTLLGGTAAFSDAAIGAGKTVTVSGLTLGGTDAGNYQLTSTTATTSATINGSISGNAGVGGAQLNYTGGTPITAAGDGSYTIIVSPTWTGTVTPSLAGYYFYPVSRTYGTALTSNQTGQDYTATPSTTTYTISGNAGLANATITYTGGSTAANGSGVYSFTVPYGWSGTVTPSKVGYSFSPVDKTYTNIMSNQPAQDFAATAIQYHLTITTGHGTVAKNPDKATYTYGEQVQLTATEDGGWGFVNWTGDVTGTDNPITVTMDGDKAVTANYIKVNRAPTFTDTGPVPVTVAINTHVDINLTAIDLDNDTLTWDISSAASHGVVEVIGGNTTTSGNPKTIRYTPAHNSSSADSFVVRVVDGNGGTATITVNVTVTGVITYYYSYLPIVIH